MPTPSVVLNIGADVAKNTIAVACSEGSFPVREIANQVADLCDGLRGFAPVARTQYLQIDLGYYQRIGNAAKLLGYQCEPGALDI